MLPKMNSGEHDAARRPDAANQQRHQESSKGELFGYGAKNDDKNAEQNDGAAGTEHLLERKIDFGRAQGRAKKPQRRA